MKKKKNSTIDWNHFWSNVEDVEIEKENFKKAGLDVKPNIVDDAYECIFARQKELEKKSFADRVRDCSIVTKEEREHLYVMSEIAKDDPYFLALCQEKLELLETSEYMIDALTHILFKIFEGESYQKI